MPQERDVFTSAAPPTAGLSVTGAPTSNPAEFVSRLNVNEEQKRNLESIAVGGGTALIHKILTPYIGEELAGTAGGLVSAVLAKQLKKMMGGG